MQSTNPLVSLRNSLRRWLLGKEMLNRLEDEHKIIVQAARLTYTTEGDYLEFGVWTGRSFAEAYHEIPKAFDYSKSWHPTKCTTRFFAFDSFKGLPGIKGVDEGGPFQKGDYCCEQEKFLSYLKSQSVDLCDVICVPGWYDKSLTEEVKTQHNLRQARIIHIDCDLYESTRDVLAFCTSLIQEGTVLIFDDWFQYKGNPQLGEHRAFNEWLGKNPEFQAIEFMREPPFRNSFILTRKI